MTIDQINAMVEPVMDLPALRVERKDMGEWLHVPIKVDVGGAWMDGERDTAANMRIAVYGLWAKTKTVIATGRRTVVYTYRLHHFEKG